MKVTVRQEGARLTVDDVSCWHGFRFPEDTALLEDVTIIADGGDRSSAFFVRHVKAARDSAARARERRSIRRETERAGRAAEAAAKAAARQELARQQAEEKRKMEFERAKAKAMAKAAGARAKSQRLVELRQIAVYQLAASAA